MKNSSVSFAASFIEGVQRSREGVKSTIVKSKIKTS